MDSDPSTRHAKLLERMCRLREKYFQVGNQAVRDKAFQKIDQIYRRAAELLPESRRHLPVVSRRPVAFLVSYPRSGNTLAHRMLTTLFDTREYQAFDGSGPFTFSKLLYDADEPRVRIVKDHFYRSEYLWDRVIVVVRDGRDACLSLAHYSHREGLHAFVGRGELADFLRFTGDEYPFGDWMTNVRTALNARRLGADVRIVHYEDILTNNEAVLDLARFVDANCELDLPRIAAVRNDVESRRRQIDRPAWGYDTTYDESSYLHAWSRNRMGSNWRASYDRDAARVFHEMGGTELLMELGYETDSDWWRKQTC
jgi:Sulfotransferase domain